jgi:hypothetical protein
MPNTKTRPAVAFFDHIAQPDQTRLHVRCTLPDENERPIVLVLDAADAATISYHAEKFVRATEPRRTRIRTAAGRTVTARPLVDVLNPNTRAFLAQLQSGGNNGRR